MVHLDMQNSRMKDFCDIWILSRTLAFSGPALRQAIRSTFDRRRTRVPLVPPTALTEKFYSEPVHLRQWAAFVRRIGEPLWQTSFRKSSPIWLSFPYRRPRQRRRRPSFLFVGSRWVRGSTDDRPRSRNEEFKSNSRVHPAGAPHARFTDEARSLPDNLRSPVHHPMSHSEATCHYDLSRLRDGPANACNVSC